MIERRKRARHAGARYYCGFTDRRQPPGIVVTWERVHGGELIRHRRNLPHLARVLTAKRGATPDELPEPTALPFGTLTWGQHAPALLVRDESVGGFLVAASFGTRGWR